VLEYRERRATESSDLPLDQLLPLLRERIGGRG
jgi:hypothetical protein